MDQAQELKKLADEIVKNKVCPALASQATQLVLGEGNPNADIVFIGEAPGAEEDKQGKPFVGRAGQFLNDMLQLIHLERSDVYITNIVKYRPPNNRDPEPDEKAEFLPYLHKQLAIIKPKLIVTLGRHSMSAFLPDFRISEIHGQPKRTSGIVYLPLYHPAAALYNSSMKEILMADFKKIPKILDQLKN
ncbi:MAG TPA: uracil-DNA glycosylase [Candidatus Saccharimonadales bacterium]